MNAPATRETSPAKPCALPDRLPNGRFPIGVAQTLRHGMSGHRIYRIWSGMLARCHTPSASGYANYGGRGITVCDRWRSFDNFFADMGEAWHEGATIDRVNNDAGYSPENCRWSSRKEQNRNQRDLIFLEFNGQRKCVSAWAEDLGMPSASIRARVKRGWSVEKTLLTPIRGHKPYERNREA